MNVCDKNQYTPSKQLFSSSLIAVFGVHTSNTFSQLKVNSAKELLGTNKLILFKVLLPVKGF